MTLTSQQFLIVSIHVFGAAASALLRLPEVQIRVFFSILRMNEQALQDLYDSEILDQELPEFTSLRWYMMTYVLFQILESRETELQNTIAKSIELEKLSHMLSQSCKNLQISNCDFTIKHDAMIGESQSLSKQLDTLKTKYKKLQDKYTELQSELDTTVTEHEDAYEHQLYLKAMAIAELESNLSQSQQQAYILGEELNAIKLNGARFEFINLVNTDGTAEEKDDSVDLTHNSHGYSDPRVIACIASSQVTTSSPDKSTPLDSSSAYRSPDISSPDESTPDESTDDDSDLEFQIQKAADQMDYESGWESGSSSSSAINVD
jgi:hypothetical protein